jgi:hypothetical protein
MSILYIILVLALIGVALWVLNTQVPWIDPTIKRIINVVVFIAIVIWLMKVFGLWDILLTARV